MLKRDYLTRQIQQLARAMGEILARLLENPVEPETSIAEARAEIEKLLDIAIDDEQVDGQEFISDLTSHGIRDETLLDSLAQVLTGLAEKKTEAQDAEGAAVYRAKALAIYEHLVANATTFNFSWLDRISKLKS